MQSKTDRYTGKPIPEHWSGIGPLHRATDPCEHCGGTEMVAGCPLCGAPECCPSCCQGRLIFVSPKPRESP